MQINCLACQDRQSEDVYPYAMNDSVVALQRIFSGEMLTQCDGLLHVFLCCYSDISFVGEKVDFFISDRRYFVRSICSSRFRMERVYPYASIVK